MKYKSEEYLKRINSNNTIILGKTFLKWLLIGSLIGIFIGGVIAAFLKSLEWATDYRINHGWVLFLLPIGGALVSFLYYKFGRNSVKGNNLIIENINEYCGDIPLRMVPLVFFGTVVTHFFGGSAGREGTGVQIGASIAETIGKLLKLNEEDSKIMLMAGVSGGFSAIFGTPLAGTIFGLEVSVLGKMSYEALIPSFFASIVGNEVVKRLGVHHSHYEVFGVPSFSVIILLKIIISAICFGLASKLFSQLTHKLKEIFSNKFKNTSLKSFLGGCIVILLVYIVGSRKYLGLSLPLLSEAFTGHVAPLDFLGKLIFTSITLGAGYQGGEVTPLFVIGSTLGNTLSGILNLSPSFLAALGLVGVFAGATNTPIASFVLGLEMFGLSGAPYLFMACAISYIFSGHTGIYSSQKIGVSKSNLIVFPKNSTLFSYNKKEIN
ncbi:voltage-gated chloride channel protein [Clostridium perfringens]|nr:voltage-gated chloride channel protein [Clostridium perfringens]